MAKLSKRNIFTFKYLNISDGKLQLRYLEISRNVYYDVKKARKSKIFVESDR